MDQEEEFLGVYREIAASAIQNWEGKTKEEARDTARKESIDKLDDEHVWGNVSISAAVESLVNQLGLKDSINPASVVKDIYDEREGNSKDFATIGEKLRSAESINAVVIQALSDIHDSWCKDNAKKFFVAGRNRQFQHQELELIGWGEAQSDLIFIRPIFKKMGFDIDMKALEQEYLERQAKFLQDRNIYDSEAHKGYTSKGEYLDKLASELEDDNPKKEIMQASVECLRNNGEIDGEGSLDAIIRQSENSAKISYPPSRLAQMRDEVKKQEINPAEN